MPRFAANLSMMYREHAFLDRFGAAAKDGFKGIEFLFPYAYPATKLRQYIAGVGHIQIAGVPERHEPDAGEITYPYLFRLMDELGYAGWVGCAYRPNSGTAAGPGWLRPWR